MQQHYNLLGLCIVALVGGLVFSVPLLQSNLNISPSITFERPFITFNVAYAYFSLTSYSQNITGLSRTSLVDYIMVVNITNHSNITVDIAGVAVYAAENISTVNTETEFSQSSNGQFLTQDIGFDPYATDFSTKALPYLGPQQSKLIGLSGTSDLDNSTILQSGVFYMGGKLEGSVSEWHFTWGGSEQVHVKNFGKEYLYNNLISGNQALHIQGNYVYIS